MTEINRTLSRNHAGTSSTWATIVFTFVIVWALPVFGVESGRPPGESTRTPASGISIHATAELPGVRVLEHVSYDWSRASYFAQTGWRDNDFTVSPILMEKPVAELRKPRYLHAAEKGLLKNYSRFGAASPGPAFSLLLSISVRSPARPYGDSGFQGRIALSHDGNFNDEDDWGAFPVTIAILDAFGVKDKLVHIEYNNILQANDPRFEKEMSASVLGAAEHYGLPATILHNCRTDLTGTIESIKNAVNASSCANPLYYLLAGPMDVPYRGLLAADPAKRRYVYCISHSSWNDGYGKRRIEGRNKRDLIALGVKWIQVGQGDRLAYPGTPGTKSTPAQWALFHWMRDARDVRLHWLFTRLEAEERCDVSDATMAYFLLTGDEKCDPKKLAALLDKKQRPSPIAIRPTIRLEAENFRLLENCAPVTIGKQASQSVAVRMAGASRSLMRTEFHEIHAAGSGRYDVAIRYRESGGGASPTLQLRVNGVPRGDAWNAEANDNGWKSHTVTQVLLCQGDEIEVVGRVPVRASGENASRHHDGSAEIDFVQLTYLGRDDPAALPGQIVVDPAHPWWLKYNGGERCFLFGAGNPEEFFFFGKRQVDGTRAGGRQSSMIRKLAGTGANTFHVLALRDSRYNLEPGNGAPDGNPFEDCDISGALDEDILNQWESWLDEMEAAGLNVLFNFYNDFDDTVEQVMAVAAGDQTWSRPPAIGPEAALYLKRLDGVVSPESK